MESIDLDKRDQEALYEQLTELAASYTPEWHFDRKNPDAGSVIALIYAGQMAENIKKLNQVLDKYQVEFVNMLGVSLEPAKPACAMVVVDMVDHVLDGVPVKKGTQLLGDSPKQDGEERIVFETLQNVYVTGSRLCYAYMTDEDSGKIIPVFGKLVEEKVNLPGAQQETEETEDDDEAFGTNGRGVGDIPSFTMFSNDAQGIDKNQLFIYHSNIFDIERENIYIRLAGNQKLIEKIATGEYVFYYFSPKGKEQVEHVETLDDMIILSKEKVNQKVTEHGRDYSVLLLESKQKQPENVEITGIELSSSGIPKAPVYVSDGISEGEVSEFRPFGETLSLYQEFYIGEGYYFNKPGALVTMDFDLSFDSHYVSPNLLKEEENLKIIKRKPRFVFTETDVDCYVDEISIEYYNGIGWKRLRCREEYAQMFAKGTGGRMKLSFICPEDWAPSSVSGYNERCIRLQILRSENCYMQPCTHHYPIMRNFRISYTYENRFVKPELLRRISGNKKEDLTDQMIAGEPVTIFTRSYYSGRSLFLGFDKRFESGPISLLFRFQDNPNFQGMKIKVEYLSKSGFKRLKVLDHTLGLKNTGTIVFMPPEDMSLEELEGRKCFWLRISDCRYEESRLKKQEILPKISSINLNAIECYNIETLPVEDYFIDESVPNMEFDLSGSNIMSVDVWVNEKGEFTDETMKRMLTEQPQNIMVERNFMGDIEQFFVKWTEVKNFATSKRGDRHFILDRLNNRLIFGDGIRVKIPKVVKDVSFRVQIKKCNGSDGNLPAFSINRSLSNMLFVENMYNPIPAFGGSDIENMESALRRGSNIISGRNRLVTLADYEAEVLSYSDNIDKVKCMVGQSIDGRKDDRIISIVVLMKDFLDGSNSFIKIRDEFKVHLAEHCELTVDPEDIEIVEPVFVEVSVDVWAQIMDWDESFEIQERLREKLDDFLNPITDETHIGWKIGELPRKSQIAMQLGTLKSKAIIKRTVLTGKYEDANGVHERELSELADMPYVVCKNGVHRIHLSTDSV